MERFRLHMERLLGSAEASRLVEAVRQPSSRSVRFNRLQCSTNELTGLPVPWCVPYGRYYQESEDNIPASGTIAYATGKYYIQEAAAMLAISAASQVIDFKGKIVLDLTAAPGGKTTQAAELVGPGFLVANEVVRKRVDALMWNVNRHRLNNVIITSMPTQELPPALPSFFDIIIVDAPCSGEGLFKMKKHSPAKWSEKNVQFCARRQTSILADADRLLKPGGYVVYSTCTFSKEENENQVEQLLNQGWIPVPLPSDLPVSPAISNYPGVQACSRRIFPHREGGAGAFVGIIQKEPAPCPPFHGDWVHYDYGHFNYDRYGMKPPPVTPSQLKDQSTDSNGFFYEKGGVVHYFSHPQIPSFLLQKNIQMGVPIADKRRDNEWMYGSVQLATPENAITLDRHQADSYIRGEELQLDFPDGHHFVSHAGMVLGPVKIIQKRAHNKYPMPLRKKNKKNKHPKAFSIEF